MAHIGYPWVLTLLIIAPVMAFYFRRASRKDAQARDSFADAVRQPALNLGLSISRRAPILLLAACALASVALARPLGPPAAGGDTPVGMDVIVALDVSDSMAVPDVLPDRLAAAKDLVARLVKAAPSNRYGLVLFSGDAVVTCPLTLDHDAYLGFLQDADYARVGLPGTAIGEGILACVTRFKKSGLPMAVLVISDGENTYGAGPVKAASTAREKGLKVYTVGVGTAAGGRIPAGADFFGAVQYKRDRQGRIVNSALDEETLKAVAVAGGGGYFSASEPGAPGALDRLKAELTVKEAKRMADPFRGAKEYGPYFLLAAFCVLSAALVF